MSCENRVYYVVPSNGYDYREVSVACGGTDYYGQQRFCANCEANPVDVENAAADIINEPDFWKIVVIFIGVGYFISTIS